MHKESELHAHRFIRKYLDERTVLTILDVGSYDYNGSLRSVFRPHQNWTYLGLDIEKGKNVDIVGELNKFPLANDSFDVVVSSSCFEHAKFFWVTFNEMVRVLKPGGWMYINTPSKGGYHGYPQDCWRFYKDAYQALSEWNGKISLVEQYIVEEGHWGDNVGIFRK